MIASACGPNERYIGIYMVEGDPSYTIELHTETDDPKVIEELDKLNTEQFDRGQTPLRILWRFLDPSFPPRVRFSRPLHEAKDELAVRSKAVPQSSVHAMLRRFFSILPTDR